jgi:hypothetical protein
MMGSTSEEETAPPAKTKMMLHMGREVFKEKT